MKVLFLTNLPSPYRVDFFNEFGKYVDLTVVFERGSSSERDETWKNYKVTNFTSIILKGHKVSVDKAVCPSVRHYLTKKWDRIICSNTFTPTGMIAILTMKFKRIEYWIEGDGGFVKPENAIKRWAKSLFISGAKGYFSTGREHDKYYLHYGAKVELVHRYPFTSVSKKYLKDASLAYDKKMLKKQIAIKEEIIILAVGQFIKRKGFDILLKSLKGLTGNIGIYFVGGYPTNEYQEIVDNLRLTNVHFVGFKGSKELMDYFRIADIFVLPTREDIWGLVINEAMAFSLPIITTDRCIAGTELVDNEKNGYIVPNEDERQLQQKMQILVDNSEKRIQFGKESNRRIEKYTIEEMAKVHWRVLANE